MVCIARFFFQFLDLYVKINITIFNELQKVPTRLLERYRFVN